MKNKQKIYMITCISLIIDQLIKLIISRTMKLYQSITIIKNFFSITYVKNTGAAFSILKDNTLFLIIISVIFILLLNHYIKKENNYTKLSIISYGLIMGGIFGNLIDRVMHHAVIDFLSFTIISYEFPIFNIADICITIGIILFIISSIIEKKENDNVKTIKKK